VRRADVGIPGGDARRLRVLLDRGDRGESRAGASRDRRSRLSRLPPRPPFGGPLDHSSDRRLGAAHACVRLFPLDDVREPCPPVAAATSGANAMAWPPWPTALSVPTNVVVLPFISSRTSARRR